MQRENGIIDGLRDVIKRTAKDKGYDYVLESSMGGVLHAPEDADITDDVIKAYDEEFKRSPTGYPLQRGSGDFVEAMAFKFTLSEIANAIGGDVRGDASIEIGGIAGLEEAKRGDIAFLSNPKYEKFLDTTRASAVIVSVKTKTTEGKNSWW